jgi:rare lipoprotein A
VATSGAVVAASRTDAARPINPCAPTREHRDSDYTPGGLYAPGVADGGPATAIDVSGLVEPVPRDEPRARQGNRSPYTVLGKSYKVMDHARGYHERGVASWYGTKFNGRATSSGELYDICAFTAAHKTLPLPSYVRVTNLDNGRSLVVRVNDRGPFHSGRIMDLSYAAAVRLGVDRTGTARVELESVGAKDRGGAPLFAGGPEGSVNGPKLPGKLIQPATDMPPAQGEAAASNAQNSLRPGSNAIVQVGAFGEKTNARRLADRLQGAGVDDVDVDHADVSGRDVWRVRIGPVDLGDLTALLSRLRQLDLPEPRVFSE